SAGPRSSAPARARQPLTLANPPPEILDAVEFELGSDPVDEADVDHLAIEVAGKIEQKDFEQHGAGIEHRAPAEARDAVVAALADADPHRVDAVLEAAGRIEPQIGGGKAEVTAALVAVDDLCAHEPGIAEERLRFGNLAGGERGAERAGT